MQQPPNSYQQYPQFQQPQQQTDYKQSQTHYPQQQPWNPQQAPFTSQQYQPPISQLPKKKPRKRLWLILAAIVLILAVMIGVASLGQSQQPAPAAQATHQPTTQTTTQPTKTPTPQSIHYPPKTQADLRGLAAKGDASAIHEFHSESVGLVGACPQPKREVTVDPSLTGQQLAEDLLAYFYGQQLDSPCGSLVLAYHNQSETGDAYTAGRINFDATDSSGATNVDPNATNLKYTLTLDIGGVLSGQQEYIVAY